jgi:hypothetical protein
MRTLADALDNYLDFLKTNRKSADEVRSTINAIIKPELGHIKLKQPDNGADPEMAQRRRSFASPGANQEGRGPAVQARLR